MAKVVGSARNDEAFRGSYREEEQRIARCLCIAAPVLFVVGHVVLTVGARALFLLDPSNVRWVGLTSLGLSTVAAAGLATLPFMWLLALRIERSLPLQPIVPSALLLALVIALVANAVFSTSTARWFLVEGSKIRAPQYGFVRSTLFWEQGMRDPIPDRAGAKRIGLIGASQMNFGTDAELLAKLTGATVEKRTLPGFGPMQYAMWAEAIADRELDVVVCWLSEFDMFRDSRLPVETLRWASNPAGLSHIMGLLDSRTLWRERGAIADLALAAVSPLWRDQARWRLAVSRLWWKAELRPAGASDVVQVGAQMANLQLAAENARRNVQRTPLLDANFESFRVFVKALQRRGTEVLVLEGQSHRLVMSAYDSSFRTETGARLLRMAEEEGFQFIRASELPLFSSDDFSDAYHLGDAARDRLTKHLSTLLEVP